MIECIGYREVNKGALEGFANFRLPKIGMEIYGCGVYSKNGRRWVNLPTREYKDPNTNETKYASIIKIINADHYKKFCEKAVYLVELFRKEQQEKNQQQAQPAQKFDLDEQVPF